MVSESQQRILAALVKGHDQIISGALRAIRKSISSHVLTEPPCPECDELGGLQSGNTPGRHLVNQHNTIPRSPLARPHGLDGEEIASPAVGEPTGSDQMGDNRSYQPDSPSLQG